LLYVSVLAGLTTAFCWGTADYMSRRQSEKVGYYPTVVYSNLATLVVLIALFPIISPNPAFPAIPVLVLVASGGVLFVAFLFLYNAFQ
jgi:drug/metabolite transporter (DMT)-like permease